MRTKISSREVPFSRRITTVVSSPGFPAGFRQASLLAPICSALLGTWGEVPGLS